MPGRRRNAVYDSLKFQERTELAWDRGLHRESGLIAERREARKRGDLERVSELGREIRRSIMERQDRE